jgi:hypothetical protein
MQDDLPDLLQPHALVHLMDPEQCEHVVCVVLEYVRTSDTRTSRRVKRLLREAVKINGFRDPIKALPTRFQSVCDSTVFEIRRRAALAVAVFDAWCELETELRQIVEEALEASGVQRYPLSEGIRPQESPSPLKTMIEALIDTHPDLDSHDLLLMTQCLSGQVLVAPEQADTPLDDAAEPGADGALAAEPAHEQLQAKPINWDTVLADLATLPAGAPEWDEASMAGFIQAASKLAAEKRAERKAEQARLSAALAALHQQSARLLFVVVESSAANWDVQYVPPARVLAVTDSVELLVELLNEHALLEARSYRNALERDHGLHELREIEERIRLAHTKLTAEFPSTPPTPVQEPPAGGQKPAEDTAPAAPAHANSERCWAMPSTIETGLVCQPRANDTPQLRQWREHFLPELVAGDAKLLPVLWDSIASPWPEMLERLREYALVQGWTEQSLRAWGADTLVSTAGMLYLPQSIAPASHLDQLRAHGVLQYTAGQGIELHIAALASLGCTEAIMNRLWRAQLNLVLSLANSVRLRICEYLTAHCGRNWPVRWALPKEPRDVAVVQANPNSCEFGHLLYLLRYHVDRPTRSRWLELAEQAKLVRDTVAHYQPITFAMFEKLWRLQTMPIKAHPALHSSPLLSVGHAV